MGHDVRMSNIHPSMGDVDEGHGIIRGEHAVLYIQLGLCDFQIDLLFRLPIKEFPLQRPIRVSPDGQCGRVALIASFCNHATPRSVPCARSRRRGCGCCSWLPPMPSDRGTSVLPSRPRLTPFA